MRTRHRNREREWQRARERRESLLWQLLTECYVALESLEPEHAMLPRLATVLAADDQETGGRKQKGS